MVRVVRLGCGFGNFLSFALGGLLGLCLVLGEAEIRGILWPEMGEQGAGADAEPAV